MTTTDLINIIGTIAFAISGYLVGYGKRLDVLGVVITALLTAIGGGMMRDALVGHIPQVFLRTDALIVVFATLACAFGSAPKAVLAPLKILDLVLSWTWISNPITVSQVIDGLSA